MPTKRISARKYSPAASKGVERDMHKFKRGKLKSGPGGKGGTVKNRKQAIASALSEARKQGKKVPKKTTLKKAQRDLFRTAAKRRAGRQGHNHHDGDHCQI